jgi:hypothetical protein
MYHFFPPRPIKGIHKNKKGGTTRQEQNDNKKDPSPAEKYLSGSCNYYSLKSIIDRSPPAGDVAGKLKKMLL